MTSTLLANHLEQISLCATSIGELEFPGAKMFTNALLATHDITALIRDTELHERALFSLAPPPMPTKSQSQLFSASLAGATNSASRQSTTANAARQPKRNTAVATVLGGDLYRKVKRAETGTVSRPYGSARSVENGELDVEVLLAGAEKLCGVYPTAGSAEKIASLRERYEQLTANISHYQDRVARNAQQLDLMYQRTGHDDADFEDDDFAGPAIPARTNAPGMTREDLEREEQEIKDLERKKRGLEERVTGMEKDLGGLMR